VEGLKLLSSLISTEFLLTNILPIVGKDQSFIASVDIKVLRDKRRGSRLDGKTLEIVIKLLHLQAKMIQMNEVVCLEEHLVSGQAYVGWVLAKLFKQSMKCKLF
jgi:hypothetical protein